ncbi:MAG: SRPBCC family protein [Pseudomonadota bacterium]|nr:SRPBCC family protein [Pseudomonadota bacterium]
MRIDCQVDIEAPAAHVWPYVSDPLQWHLWMPELHQISLPDDYDAHNPVGASFRQTIRARLGASATKGTITSCSPLTHFGFRVEDRGASQQVDLHLSPMGTGTCLSCESQVTATSIHARLRYLLHSPFEVRRISRQMSRLKQLAEESVSPAAG